MTEPALAANDECLRLLGKIKYLKSPRVTKSLATSQAVALWREEVRSDAAQLATELLTLNPDIAPLA